MSKKFKLGIVGCGDIAGYIGLGVRLNPKIEIVACSDPNEERVLAYAKKNKVKYHCADYRDMLNDVEMDAIYLGVPHYLHYPMIVDAVEKGIHIFCEKPVCCTMEDALDLCSISEKAGVKIGINYQYRYDKACYAMTRAVQKEQLGEILYGRCNLPWFREDDYFDDGQWRVRCATAGGGTLITQASHIMDISLWAVGKQPVAAQGMMTQRKFKNVEVEDLCMGILELEGGGSISVTSSMIVNPEMPVTIELYGTEGTAIYTGPEKPKVKFYGQKIKKEKPPVWGFHALLRSLEGFRQWIVSDVPYLTPIEQSLPVLASVLAIYKSAESGKREPVDNKYLKYLINRN